MLLAFVWLQIISKNDVFFLFWMYFSFFFLGLATVLMLQSRVEQASRRLRRAFYGLAVILIIVTVAVALWIASVPAGGTRHNSYLTPNDVQMRLTYGWATSGKPGYRGSVEQNLLEVNYPVGAAWVFYDLDGTHVFTDKDIQANVTLWFSLLFFPNGREYRAIYTSEIATAWQNGTDGPVAFHNAPFSIFWGADLPEWRDRLDKGYGVSVTLDVEIESPDYGPLNATIPLYPGVQISDVQVSSQLQDGIAILTCGIFTAMLCSITAKPLMPRITNRMAPALHRMSKTLTPETTAYLKQCAQCGKQIPIASEECPHCNAKQS